MTVRSFVLQVIVLGYSLTAGAFHSNPPSFLNEPGGLIRLGIAVAAGMLGVVVRDRQSPTRQRSPNSLLLDIIVIYGLIVLSQVLLALLSPALSLPNWAPTQGGFVGIMLFTAARALFAAPTADDGNGSAEWRNEIGEELIKEAKRYRTAYLIASSVAVGLSGLGFALTARRGQIASALLMIGSVYLLRRTLSGQASIAAGFPERLLAILQSATRWYYLALFPSSIVVLFGSKVYLYWIPVVILMFGEANQRLAASLLCNCEWEANWRGSAASCGLTGPHE